VLTFSTFVFCSVPLFIAHSVVCTVLPLCNLQPSWRTFSSPAEGSAGVCGIHGRGRQIPALLLQLLPCFFILPASHHFSFFSYWLIIFTLWLFHFVKTDVRNKLLIFLMTVANTIYLWYLQIFWHRDQTAVSAALFRSSPVWG
jgi:hypothetical protein